MLFWVSPQIVLLCLQMLRIKVLHLQKLKQKKVTLSTQANVKLLTQLKPGFKRAINWNKCLSKPELLA